MPFGRRSAWSWSFIDSLNRCRTRAGIHRLHGWSGLVVLNLAFTVVLTIIAVLIVWVRLAGAQSDLQGWHLQFPQSEFYAADADANYTLENYLEQEQRVFGELEVLIAGPWAKQIVGAYSRFRADSVSNPETIVDRNWNRTYILKAPKPIGGVLLLHGLGDSPYSLRALGQRLHAEGYTVIWLRIPGHGTCPAALANVSSKDWIAAVKVAMRSLRDLIARRDTVDIGRLFQRWSTERPVRALGHQRRDLAQAQSDCLVCPDDRHQSRGQASRGCITSLP